MEQVTEEELMDACALGDSTGMFNCPHTGTGLAALMKLRSRNVINSKDKVVVISTAHGLKFTDSKIKYHENDLSGITCKYANSIVESSADASSVLSILHDRLL